jgi:pimeloyl-ACP methyl ester carboxylesterase
MREALDRLAYRQPRVPPAKERVNIAGTIPAFLLSRLDLPVEDELQRSRAVHDEKRKLVRVLPTPVVAQRLLDRLANEVPTYQKPGDLRFSLTMFADTESTVDSPGGGFIHLTKPLVDRVLTDPKRGESALAFLLARQLAHVALGHCRRGWQRVLLEEEARKGIAQIDPSVWRDLLETKVIASGKVIQFLYSRNQETRADLYALHLCRNAGFALDPAIDGMRFLAALHPGVPRTEYEGWLLRLKRLLMERDGGVEPDEQFGLFLYDRKSAELVPCRDGSVRKGQRAIVVVHGLFGTSESFLPMLGHLAEQKRFDDRPLLVFRHPGNSSLARSGHFLSREIERVIAEPRRTTFICHSAGGLVFRCYAEKREGPFDRAVILATPHKGSDLTRLKFLVDLLEFAGAMRLGFAEGISRLLAEGRGEIGLDLHPDSLFLRYLGDKKSQRTRYHIFYGEWLNPVQARAIEATFTVLRRELEPKLLRELPAGLVRRQAEKLLRAMTLPAELLQGDGVVSVESARLAGAAKTTKLRLRHLAFRSHPDALRLVSEALTD